MVLRGCVLMCALGGAADTALERELEQKHAREHTGKGPNDNRPSWGPIGSEVAGEACAVCGIAATLRCGRCKAVWYDCTACQRAHWPEHRETKRVHSWQSRFCRHTLRGSLHSCGTSSSHEAPR